MSAKAAKESNRAAEHAFPVDLCPAMFLASSLTSTHFFEDAFLAEKIFLLGITLLSILLLTVNETTEERLLAAMALVERAAAVCKFLRLVVVGVTQSSKSLII